MASNCQISTPQEYVIKLLDSVCYSKNLYGKKVLENSCGEGNVLIEIVKRYIESAKEEKYSLDEIKEGLSRDIVAYEIDEECIKKCKIRLNNFVHIYGLNEVNWNIYNEDFLTQSVVEEFDYVIGNPPYITYHDMSDTQKKLLKTQFKTCKKGRCDYCYGFIEASLKSLAIQGKMAYLVPYSIITNKFAEELRKYMLPYITKIIDYRTIKIFSEALTSSVIIVCEKENKHEYITYNLVSDNHILKTPKKCLTNKWAVLVKQNVAGIRFGDCFEVRNSVATLLNEAFILKDYEYDNHCYIVGDHKIEDALVKDAASTKSLNKKKSCDKIIFPYRIIDGKKVDYTVDEFKNKFPYATAYFEQFEKKLCDRKADKNALWFQYGRSQAIASVYGEKLIIPMVFTEQIHVYKVGEYAIPYAGYFIKCKDERKWDLDDAKKILESDDFYNYVKSCGTPTTPTSYRISVDDIKSYIINMR